jgi:hypothetical protein
MVLFWPKGMPLEKNADPGIWLQTACPTEIGEIPFQGYMSIPAKRFDKRIHESNGPVDVQQIHRNLHL